MTMSRSAPTSVSTGQHLVLHGLHQGVKIDNLVQIGHNVVIGAHSLLVAQVGIAGSAQLGREVVLAGQVGVNGHIRIGDRVTVGGKAGVESHVPSGARVSGFPVLPHSEWLRAAVAFGKIPSLFQEIRKLKQRISQLEFSVIHGNK